MILELQDHQRTAIAALERAVAAGRLRNLVVNPTGTGKTVVGLAYSALLGRTLWLAHRDELIDQPARTLKRFWAERDYGVVKGPQDDWHPPIVFGSVASVSQARRLEADCGEPFALIVIDEAHHAAKGTLYERVVERFAPEGSQTQVLGLTATPQRADGKGLDWLFGKVAAYSLTPARAIELGLLVPAVPDSVVLEGLDISKVETAKGDFDQEALGRELLRAGAAEAVARKVLERAAGRKTVVFTCSVDQAVRTADALTKLGIPADWVAGAPARKKKERERVLAAHKNGEIAVLVNCAVLTEGYDDPGIDCVVVARPTKSSSLYLQIVGRGLRIDRDNPNKVDCLILDLVGAHEIHGMKTVMTLAGKNVYGGLRADVEELTATEAAVAAGRGADELLMSFLRLATAVKKSTEIVGSRAAWVHAREDIHALDCGRDGGIICVREVAPDLWRAEVLEKGRAPAPLDARSDADADGAEDAALQVVQVRAEAFARSRGWVANRTADWRKRPASPGRLAALDRFRRRPKGPDGEKKADADITAGEASDILTSAIVQMAYRTVRACRAAEARKLIPKLLTKGVSLRLHPDDPGRLLARVEGGQLPADISSSLLDLKPELLELVKRNSA